MTRAHQLNQDLTVLVTQKRNASSGKGSALEDVQADLEYVVFVSTWTSYENHIIYVRYI